eukprot:TRINITY_DN17257_c0_g1_i1.p1 TRINITY_DN17257_c0_g1~~TRINITY_DN17257_c0_g1_i1.p1  ORF type:complete len:245 (+),score=33.94 TRINITY_DN17257_c0_g1_i1:353-1087(+)
MGSEAIDKIVTSATLKSPDGEDLTYVSHHLLDNARKAVLAASFIECRSEEKLIVAIVAKSASGDVRELTAVHDGEKIEFLSASCQITYEDLTPSECVEFSFAETPGEWALAQISREALEHYRGVKFEAWQKMLKEPTCEAQFRRMLQIGLVTRLYDPHVFPTPEKLLSTYQVIDERTGKVIQLPHPASELRIWNASAQKYDAIDTQLTGAPGDGEKDAWWQSFIDEMNRIHGEEYITGLLAGAR